MEVQRRRLNDVILSEAEYGKVLNESRKMDKLIIKAMKKKYLKKSTKEMYIERIIKLEDALAATNNPILQDTYREHIKYLRQELVSR